MKILGLDIQRPARPTPADLLAEQTRERRGDPAAFQSSPHGGGWGTSQPGAWQGVTSIVPGGRPAAGVRVTEETSLAVASVFAAVRVLSESVSSLPLKLYRRDGVRRMPAPEHPLYALLHDQGNDLMSAMKLREVMMVHLVLWGNFFGEKVRDGRDVVVGIWPIHPARVTVSVTHGDLGRARFAYKIDGVEGALGHDDVFHVAGLGTGLLGKSPVQLHREGLGIALAAEGYGARFFRNDARPGVVLKHPGVLGDEAYNRMKADHNEEHQGVRNSHKVMILEEGMDITTVGLPPEDAQFIETRKYQREEVAAIFRVPPHMIGDLSRATFSNIEHQGLEFVMHSLRPWLVRIEQAISVQLLTPAERATYYASHVVDGLLRGDIASRYQAYAVGRNWGWLSANDIRALEDLNPVDGGDAYLQPLNMVEAGTDPYAPADGGTEGDRSRRSLPAGAETRAMPTRYEAARALESVYLDALRAALRREVRAIGDAADTHLGGETPDVRAFSDWLVAWAGEHEAWTARRTAPAFAAMAEAMVEAARDELGADVDDGALDTFVRDYTAAFARRYAGSARGQMLALVEARVVAEARAAVRARLEEWQESTEASGSRAEKEARNERVRSSNAMTRAAWALVGVATLTWRTVGRSCPICVEMDGRSASASSSFLNAGDTVAPADGTSALDVDSRITHPPLHQGCDCILMPGGGSRAAMPEGARRALFADLCGADVSVETSAETTWVQRRNAWMRDLYTRDRADGRSRSDIIAALQEGEFERQPYSLAWDTVRKACDGQTG